MCPNDQVFSGNDAGRLCCWKSRGTNIFCHGGKDKMSHISFRVRFHLPRCLCLDKFVSTLLQRQFSRENLRIPDLRSFSNYSSNIPIGLLHLDTLDLPQPSNAGQEHTLNIFNPYFYPETHYIRCGLVYPHPMPWGPPSCGIFCLLVCG